jgi:hypothetical protein
VNVASDTTRKITETAGTCDTIEVLQPARIGEGARQNELLLFLKPEVFLLPESGYSAKIIDLVFSKIAAFDAHVAGIFVVGGQVLEDKEIMSQHYGFINVLSRSASTVLNDEDKKKIENALGISINGYDILGGHEYLKQYPQETGADLDRLWFAEKSAKIRSGFYVRSVKKDDRDIILVDAFHPEQLAHYTNPSHKIVLVLLHSNTDWSVLRNEMVGHSFPEQAVPGSIRGILHQHAKEYGYDSVSIANNSVHLSAGPFEAMFEIVNFFGKIIGTELRKEPPLMLKRMLEAGIAYDQAVRVLDNPLVTLPAKSVDLFSATEDVNTSEAVELYKQNL